MGTRTRAVCLGHPGRVKATMANAVVGSHEINTIGKDTTEFHSWMSGRVAARTVCHWKPQSVAPYGVIERRGCRSKERNDAGALFSPRPARGQHL